MVRYVLALKPDLEQRYENFSYERQGFAGRNKSSGALEILPVDAFQVVPASSLFPDMNDMIRNACAALLKDIAPEMAHEILDAITKQVEEA